MFKKIFSIFAALTLSVGLWAEAPANVESVDLGLPSGLKWATFNVGATAPEGNTIYSVINHPMVKDSIADFAWIYVSGENKDYGFNIYINTDHLYGEFTSTDIEMGYTVLFDKAADDTVDIESVSSVVIAQVADTLRFTSTVNATDGQVYVITMNDYDQPSGDLPIVMNDHAKTFIYQGQIFINANGFIYNLRGMKLR